MKPLWDVCSGSPGPVCWGVEPKWIRIVPSLPTDARQIRMWGADTRGTLPSASATAIDNSISAGGACQVTR